METELLIERWYPIVRRFWFPIILGLAGLIFLGYGLIGLIASKASNDIVVEKTSNGSSSDNSSTESIIVDIEGAVVSPGVYTLPRDARIKDLIIKAGGLSEYADREYFAKNINLASKLVDGGKLYIPAKGEASSSNSSPVGSGGTASSLININNASEKELDSLSGVGPVTASKIIQNRPYQAVEDLLSKKVVNSKVFEDIKDKISVY